ncbi:MAG TPA: PAS domain S-box protein [Candidatus Binatia bacterium]|nr:PAS domain S-box protein [Candidatus Binatia bacterium]
MNEAAHQWMNQYTEVLQDYLTGKNEAALLRAHELGRSAVAEKFNVLEMVAIHQEALMAILLGRLATEESTRITQRAADLLAESLAPFELAQRSSQEGKVLSRHLNAILERQVAERTKALQQVEEKYRSIFENSIEGIFQSTFDGRFITVNPAMARIHGYESPEAMIADVTDIEHQLYVDPQRRAEFVHLLQAQGIVSEFESQVYRKDGSVIWIAEHARAIHDSEGKVVGYEGTVVDITERRRAQVFLRSLIDTTQDAVISIDRQGHIDLFNSAAAQIFGYTRAEVQGQKLQMLMPEPYASEHDGYIARYQQTGEPRAIGRIRTAAARRKNGEVFPIELSVTEIKVGDEIRYAAFIRDISEKIKLQEQLVERERLATIGTTAATFAHEVGNPLNSMYMAAQLLERRLAKRHDLVDDMLTTPLRNLMSEIMRLTVLLEEFRTLARRQKPHLRPTSLAPLVADLLAVETPAYTARGIKIEQLLPPDLPPIMADSEKLKQVLLNLCKNAAEAMLHGGTITIRAHHSREQVRLEVSDTGVGIPTGVDIFEPFITTKSQGTGLGLTIVRQIVSAHRGTLTYHSVSGEGTTFTLTLPVSQQAEP